MDPTLVTTSDGMTATLRIPAGQALSPETLRRLLHDAGVVVGLQTPALLAAGRVGAVERVLVVARGEPPSPGMDGWVEPLVREPEAAYGEGRVDLRELHHFREIHAGQGVLRLVPPHPGKPGRTVRDEEIPAPEVHPADLAPCCGPGVIISPEDPSIAVAEASGIYQRFALAGRLSLQVCQRVEVPGDIDLTIGNIDTQFPILIRGDIHSGFVVKTAADLEVDGSIEDARVTAQGSLDVKGGLLVGRQRVKAHGDLHARHCQARPIRARHVLFDMGCVGATIAARGQVQAREILGGDITAAAGVICDVLGSPEGLPTRITVGVDPFESGLHAWAVANLPLLQEALEHERERGKCLAHRIQTLLSAGEDHAADDAALRHSAQEVHGLVADITRAQEAIANHPERLAKARALEAIATIEVRRQCYPGVTVVIGDHQLLVTQALGRVRFRWSKDGIAVEG